MTDFDTSKCSVSFLACKLMGHILNKGFQVGGILGCVAVAPAVALYTGNRSAGLLTRSMGLSSLALTGISGEWAK